MTSAPSRWREEDREAVHALLDWRADLHTCGQHLDEVEGTSVDDWVGVFTNCPACNAVQRDQMAQQKKDSKEALTHGRIWRVMRRADAIAWAQQLGMKTR